MGDGAPNPQLIACGFAADALPHLPPLLGADVPDAAPHGLGCTLSDAQTALANPPAGQLLERRGLLRRRLAWSEQAVRNDRHEEDCDPTRSHHRFSRSEPA